MFSIKRVASTLSLQGEEMIFDIEMDDGDMDQVRGVVAFVDSFPPHLQPEGLSYFGCTRLRSFSWWRQTWRRSTG